VTLTELQASGRIANELAARFHLGGYETIAGSPGTSSGYEVELQ
jgi:hypothetical protein